MANCSRLIKLVASTSNCERGQPPALIIPPALCRGDLEQGPQLGWVARVCDWQPHS